MPSTDIDEFRRVLATSEKVIVVSGAGLSAASGDPICFSIIPVEQVFIVIGIATFRGAGGRWRKYDAKSVATPSAWAENQSRVWQFFHYRREE
jgi:NAD-dependent deacetylase sirtuin 5